MNPRDQLRRYLEQRRDAGETELVLDSLTVEEVMRLLGVEPTDTGESKASGRAPVDWRATLRSAERENVSQAAGPERLTPPSVSSPPASRVPPVDDLPAPRVSNRRNEFVLPETVDAEPAPAAAAPSRGTDPLESAPTGLVVGAAAHELFGGPASEFNSLADVARAVACCTKCPLSQSAKNPVPGEGSTAAQLVCVGEAPGAVEDETGRPFVGPAGQLLDKILGAISLSRNDVFICNVLKHRPPGNRNPMPDEVQACSPYLVRQIELLKPKVIIAFGTFAAQTLLNTKDAIGKLRGKIHRYYGVPLVVTYHPAALLRNPGWKRPTWEDVQLARRLLDRAVNT